MSITMFANLLLCIATYLHLHLYTCIDSAIVFFFLSGFVQWHWGKRDIVILYTIFYLVNIL